jgi:hypothetical protein
LAAAVTSRGDDAGLATIRNNCDMTAFLALLFIGHRCSIALAIMRVS